MQALVSKIKRESLLNLNPKLLLSPSPYDTAWLAMVPHVHDPTRPMFEECLKWIVQNQRTQGFWADLNDGDAETMTLDCLPATLACLVALKRWQVGPDIIISKGLEFVHANSEKLLMTEKPSDLPRWVTIMFPAMLELAWASGLQVTFPDNLSETLVELFRNRQTILSREELVEKHQCSPLLMFLEALPPSLLYDNIDDLEECLEKNLSSDGSLFQSPSATARAYMMTGNTRCLSYLESVSKTCLDGGVPSFYPVDGDLHELVMVNQLLRFGLTEHFAPEIEQILLQIKQNYENKRASVKSIHNVAAELYKDSLAFWLLRINGHSVSPSIFCWFLHDKEIPEHIEMNYRDFAAVLLNVYRAADLMFSGELELEKARSFARKYLEKILLTQRNYKKTIDISPSLHRMIEHELRLPWTARMDHLEHRMWIEESGSTTLWVGKSSYHRLSYLHSDDLLELALKSYTFRQSVYRHELEEVMRWSKERGLCDMGFGREKTTYCYFASAASTSLPCISSIRQILTKAAVVITVADDFFDTEGSIGDLEKLTDAVRRWEVEGLSNHSSKTIFEALDDLVYEVRMKCFQQHGEDIKDNLQQLWYETFNSWLTEAKWGRGRSQPSVDKYLRNAMTSIAAHTMVLSGSCLLGPGFPIHQLWSAPHHHQDVTSLLMVTTRLLNDIQSYLKEEEEGKINYVWLYMNENQEAKIGDSIQHVQALLNGRRLEFLEHVLTDHHEHSRDHLPKSFKLLHLLCFKAFSMFFNSSNIYDSETDLLPDIEKAFVLPPKVRKLNPHKATTRSPGV